MRKDNYSFQMPVEPTVPQLHLAGVENYILSTDVNLHSEAENASGALKTINMLIDTENSLRDKEDRIRKPKDVSNAVIAQLMSVRNDLVLVAPMSKHKPDNGDDYTADDVENHPFGIYQTDKRKEGTYVLTNSDRGGIAELVRRYKDDATRKDVGDVMDILRGLLKVVTPCSNPKLVPVNNGIWDMDTKTLIPFSRDYVFTSKIRTNLNPNATNPIIPLENGETWDVISWLASLGSPEFVKSLWEILQALCLVLTPFNQLVILMNKSGCNGKSTLISLMRSLLGGDTTVNIPIHDFAEKFELSPLVGANAVLCDENPVGQFYKDLSKLKACVTGDTISIKRKYKESFDYTFQGLVVQACNDYPRIEDKSGSWRRRLFILNFESNFLGIEKKYIKSDLIHRTEVLEYVLRVCLVDMDYRDRFTETELTKSALAEYTIASNSVVAFLDEILPQCTWNLLPASDYLYEIYKNWIRQVQPSGSPIGRNTFIDGVKEYVNTQLSENPLFEWEWTPETRWKGYIDLTKRELLVEKYCIEPFKKIISDYHYNSMYGSGTPDLKVLSKGYSGLKRRGFALPQGTTDNDTAQGVNDNE